jgi:hypothetical protein
MSLIFFIFIKKEKRVFLIQIVFEKALISQNKIKITTFVILIKKKRKLQLNIDLSLLN